MVNGGEGGLPDDAGAGEAVGSSPGTALGRRRAVVVSLVGVLLAVAAAGIFSLWLLDDGPGDDSIPPAQAVAVADGQPDDPGERPLQDNPADYCPLLRESNDPVVGTHQRARIVEEIQRPSSNDPSWFVFTRQALALDHLRFGETEEAVQALTEALDAAERNGADRERRVDLLEDLAVTYLKMGELDNCVSPTGSLICTLPLDNSVFQRKEEGSRKAIETLLRLLELDPDNVKARWLLNIAHMALGTYPEEVPARYVIVVDVAGEDQGVARFDEIATGVGLYAFNLAGGSIVEDFDNDGLLDIMTSTWDPCGQLTYYHNDGDGRFSAHVSRAGLDDQLGGLNLVQTDYNNDGWKDVLVMRGGWMVAAGRIRASLLRNNGDNTFTDVTHEAGIAHPAYPSQAAVWADYDNDGHLDLFACNEEGGSDFQQTVIDAPSQLFRNDGDGAFTDVASQAGVTNRRYCKGGAWGDYDNDGDPDLYVSNFGRENRLYRNNGDGTFTDVASDLGVLEPVGSFATWFWDYDNDGWLDLFVAGYGTEIEDVALDYLGLPNDGGRPRLYRNDGAGGFIDVTREAGLYRVHLTMGANFGDVDSDGFPDFYLGTGYPTFDAVGPNIMYRNSEGSRFEDVTFSGGFGHLQKGHGIAFGDLDRDGDQDVFLQVGGFYPGDGFPNALYRNPGHGNRWLSLRLVGVESNRAAIGARIRVDLETARGTRSVYARVTSGGSFGASSLEQHVGLGQAGRIAALEVVWPASGIRQVFDDVPMDSHLEITEGDDAFRVLDLPRVQFRPVR